MPTPTPDRMEAALASGLHLEPLCETWAQRIFQEQFQGDALIDDIQSLMDSWNWLSLNDPDDDIRIECILTDEVWTRVMSLILMKMQATRRRGR